GRGGGRERRRVRNWARGAPLLARGGLPPLPNVDGRSLVPEILAAARGESDGQAPRTLFSHLDRRWGRPRKDSDPLVAVSDGTLRLFLPLNAPDRVELYDHATAEAERPNLAGVRVDDPHRPPPE